MEISRKLQRPSCPLVRLNRWRHLKAGRKHGFDREVAMRAYLAWEIELVNQMATDDDQRFNVVKV